MTVMMIELGNVGLGEVFSHDESLFAVLPFDFAVDKYSTPDNLIFNLTATLKDSFKMPETK